MTTFVPILYYYQHCPYCLRVLTFAGLAGIELCRVVLLNDDEVTPIRMLGKKMLPILQTAPETYMGESLDIIDYLAQQHGLSVNISPDYHVEVEQLLQTVRVANYSLSMPRWIKLPLPEFATASAIAYFTAKKVLTIGDFDTALQKTDYFANELQQTLNRHTTLFEVLSKTPQSLSAIILFSALHGVSSVKGFAWPDEAKFFMTLMAEKSGVGLLTE